MIGLARTIHECLLRCPILSSGGGFGLERLASAFMNHPG